MVVVLICLFSSTSPANDAESSGFRAGAAKADITPTEWPVHMVGSFAPRLAHKAWDPLYVRAIVLDDGNTKMAIAVVDNCLIARSLFDEAKRRVEKNIGIPADHIMASATHTHTAPRARDFPGKKSDPKYVEQMMQGIVEAVTKANRNLEPAEFGRGSVDVPEEVFNRRWFMKPGGVNPNPFFGTIDKVRMNPPRGSKLLDRPAGPTDPEVSFVSLRSVDGRPIALLANYSLHYVGGIPPEGVSADYFGEFARLIEKKLGAKGGTHPEFVAIMSNGTSGDINNYNFRHPRKPAEPFQQMRAVAGRVAGAVTDTYPSVKHRRDVTLDIAQKKLTLNKRRPTPELVARAKKMLAAEKESPMSVQAKLYATRTLSLNEPPFTEELILQAARIGDLGVAAIPCEVFAETGLDIKKKSPLADTFTIELANGHYCYLPTPRQHALGGYETRLGTNILEIEASEKIKAVIFDLLDKVNSHGVDTPESDAKRQ
ncbi:MAG: neutral/alkaline non-lysosomal ceramidase N-terminal domain-containing protein [Pirellulales bacterium]|nr:neutral/alkaline non-lysosomal ceramidase N-terminal domain-containing protein [Pirellulales bacterium]